MKHIIVLLFLLTSCAHRMVVKREKSEFGPTNHVDGGTVKYLNAGANFIIKNRRKSAYRAAFEQCSGKWELVKEYSKSESQMLMCDNVFGCSSYDADNYIYIDYKCT